MARLPRTDPGRAKAASGSEGSSKLCWVCDGDCASSPEGIYKSLKSLRRGQRRRLDLWCVCVCLCVHAHVQACLPRSEQANLRDPPCLCLPSSKFTYMCYHTQVFMWAPWGTNSGQHAYVPCTLPTEPSFQPGDSYLKINNLK